MSPTTLRADNELMVAEKVESSIDPAENEQTRWRYSPSSPPQGPPNTSSPRRFSPICSSTSMRLAISSAVSSCSADEADESQGVTGTYGSSKSKSWSGDRWSWSCWPSDNHCSRTFPAAWIDVEESMSSSSTVIIRVSASDHSEGDHPDGRETSLRALVVCVEKIIFRSI